MPNDGQTLRIPIQLSRGRLIVPVQVELTPEILTTLQHDLLRELSRREADEVILDLSGVIILDRRDFEQLADTIEMARLMGADTIVAGLRPGVVGSLVSLGVDLDRVEAALDVDDALEMLEDRRARRTEGQVSST